MPTTWVSSFSFSIAPFGMMAELRRMASAPRSGGNGAFVVKRTVCRSTVSTRSTWSKLPRQNAGPFGSSTMSKVYLTSSAVNSPPSWNLTPRRRWKTYVVGFGVSHRSARAGTIWALASNAVRLS